jgi:hypothetical protein
VRSTLTENGCIFLQTKKFEIFSLPLHKTRICRTGSTWDLVFVLFNTYSLIHHLTFAVTLNQFTPSARFTVDSPTSFRSHILDRGTVARQFPGRTTPSRATGIIPFSIYLNHISPCPHTIRSFCCFLDANCINSPVVAISQLEGRSLLQTNAEMNLTCFVG